MPLVSIEAIPDDRWRPPHAGRKVMPEITMQVTDEQEAYLIKRGLEDEAIKAFVKVVAALRMIPDTPVESGQPVIHDAADRQRQVLHAVVCLFNCESFIR